MKPETKQIVQLVAFAAGTFTVAMLSSVAANYIMHEDKDKRKLTYVYAGTGIVASGALIYYLNKTKFKKTT